MLIEMENIWIKVPSQHCQSLIMQKLEGFGAKKLKGQVKISGSKNASLPILPQHFYLGRKFFKQSSKGKRY